MPFFFERAYRRMGEHYFLLYVAFEFVSAFIVCLATLGLFAMYTDMSGSEFWAIAVFAEVCVLLSTAFMMWRGERHVRPIIEWIRGGGSALEAWHAAVAVPRELTLTVGWQQPFVLVGVPVSIFATFQADLPPYSALIIFAGIAVAVAYAGILHFFSYEQFLRPVVEDIVDELPADFTGAPVGVPLRWKLLGALPLINVITGVVVSGLSTDGSAELNDLGLDVVIAVLVAFTISLELTVLLARSVLRPVDELLEATEAVKTGDLDARVPITSGDELGRLAGSFNEMMEGLSEREALREAFGAYVDPDVAERVLDEGELIEGQEREVTVMILDIWDFTEFAERSSARETVSFLNDMFEIVVPCVIEHGGHANKFLGDGLLAVFGAPERLEDHADRAVAAAHDIAKTLSEHLGEEVRFGIGVNSGPVVVGSVGGGGRLEFAVIGDPVNVAARVEHLTRETGDMVLVTEATRCLLSDPETELEERGDFALKGVSEPVPIYALCVRLDERSSTTAKHSQAGA